MSYEKAPEDEKAPEGDLTWRELGVKAAFQSGGQEAVEAFKMAAIVRASHNPEVAALAPLYEQIGEVWAKQAHRILQENPPLDAEAGVKEAH